jgi:amino acid transporter
MRVVSPPGPAITLPKPRGMQRAIGLRGAIAINVITMIGIGPLVTIPLVIAALGGPLALVGWIAGAIVALCDGLVWAELSSRYPGSGGTYVYLRAIFGEHSLGRALAFLFNWQFLLYAPCLLASGYIGFANYAAYIYPPAATNVALHDGIAVVAGIVTILALYRRTSRVAALATVLAGAAILTLVLVIAAAFAHPAAAAAGASGGAHLPVIHFSMGLLAGFGSALFVTLYDYVGYADAALLGDEVRQPNRTIPLAIVLSIVVVAALYILLQIGVLGAIPWRSLLDAHGQPTAESQYIGSIVVEHAWGRAAAIVATVLVLVTAFASLYGNLLGFSRISYAAARDGAFLAPFARLHPRLDIPHVALLAVGGLSLFACFLTLDQVIAVLTAGIVLIQGIAQIVALFVLRARREVAPFRMPLYPLPALVALAGWGLAFVYSGEQAILLGVGWLVAGALVFLWLARARRWWPFGTALCLAFFFCCVPHRVAAADVGWTSWHTSEIRHVAGYPEFTVDGRPFFVYGAAFFYPRIPRAKWHDAMAAYKRIGINTLDLYVPWNWHQPSADRAPDFTGDNVPERDFISVLALAREFGLKVVLRPGPVIRNEWRNGGYPDWLLLRPEYDMPAHDVYEGRYPATATLQNAHADAAGAEWMANATHLRASAQWLHDVLSVAAPYSSEIVAIALDDDQGAYLDNDTWPAPHWHAYVRWLRSTVQSTVGTRVPLFINTFESKVTAHAPAWAWGDWYQSDAYQIGGHDLAQLDFATGMLQTQVGVPHLYAEFQAGWLQGADEGAPRPSDPTNTTLALHELLRDGVTGVVSFPVQDTIDPPGWEAPWANWSYAWDAALTSDLQPSARYSPTAQFGRLIGAYGPPLAATHRVADAAIVWPPAMFEPSALHNSDVRAFADATIAAQRDCAERRLTCDVVDLSVSSAESLSHYGAIELPIVLDGRLRSSLTARARTVVAALQRAGRWTTSLAPVRPVLDLPSATLLLANDGHYGFIDAVNSRDVTEQFGPVDVRLDGRAVHVPRFDVPAHGARLIPIGGTAAEPRTVWSVAVHTPPPFASSGEMSIAGDGVRAAFAPNAGARIAELTFSGGSNVASSIGLLRDAVIPEPPASRRDYIGAYTHPLPAGTFNRPYTCTADAVTRAMSCFFDAPDLPGGGGHFERTLHIDAATHELVVEERLTPRDPSSSAVLSSISAFAMRDGDSLVAPRGASRAGVLHAGQLSALRWRPQDVRTASVRATRGAALITLVFDRSPVELRLGAYPASSTAEAERILQANPR